LATGEANEVLIDYGIADFTNIGTHFTIGSPQADMCLNMQTGKIRLIMIILAHGDRLFHIDLLMIKKKMNHVRLPFTDACMT